MKAYGGDEAYFHSFLTSVLDALSVQLYVLVNLAPLPPRKRLRYPLNKRLGGP